MNRMNLKAGLAAAVLSLAGMAQAGEFNGTYLGVYGRENVAGATGIDVSVGAFAGLNFDMGTNMVAGVEAELDYDWQSDWGGSDLTGMISARAGYDAGEALLYGKAGVGYSSAGTMVWNVGGGVDYMVTDTYLLRAEAERVDPTAAGLSTRYNIKLGAGLQF